MSRTTIDLSTGSVFAVGGGFEDGAQLADLDAQRSVCGLVGIALFGIAFLSQKVRYGAKKKNTAAAAETDEELAVS